MRYKIILNNKTLLLLSKKEFKRFIKDKPNTEFLNECRELANHLTHHLNKGGMLMVQIANDIQLNFTDNKFELSQNKIDYIDIVELTIEEAEKLAYEINQKIRCLKSLNKTS